MSYTLAELEGRAVRVPQPGTTRRSSRTPKLTFKHLRGKVVEVKDDDGQDIYVYVDEEGKVHRQVDASFPADEDEDLADSDESDDEVRVRPAKRPREPNIVNLVEFQAELDDPEVIEAEKKRRKKDKEEEADDDDEEEDEEDEEDEDDADEDDEWVPDEEDEEEDDIDDDEMDDLADEDEDEDEEVEEPESDILDEDDDDYEEIEDDD